MAKSLHFLIFNNLYYLIQTNNVTLHHLFPQISRALFLTGIVDKIDAAGHINVGS